MQQQVKEKDPYHYQEVDLQNHKRVFHALEICTITGKPYSDIRTGITKQRPFDIVKIGLNRPRPELYERINERVLEMIKEGLLEEAALYHEFKNLNTLNTVGYKELFNYFDHTWTLEFAINMIQQNSRRYAKKQLSWFNRDTAIKWFNPTEENEIMTYLTVDKNLK